MGRSVGRCTLMVVMTLMSGVLLPLVDLQLFSFEVSGSYGEGLGEDEYKELRVLSGHSDTVDVLAFSQDERYLATGSADGTVFIWDTLTWKTVATLTGHQQGISALMFYPDGRYLVSTSSDAIGFEYDVMLWDMESQIEINIISEGAWNALDLSPDGRYMAIGSSEGTVDLMNISSGAIEDTFPISMDFSPTVSFSHDGSKVAIGWGCWGS